MDIFRCSKCQNVLPQNTTVCPYCGTKNLIENQTDIVSSQENSEEINKNFTLPKKDHWLDQSIELLSNNIRDVIVVSIINNPFFLILSLFLVSAWYHSLLYRFTLALREKNTKIDFNYTSAFKEGIVIFVINSIVMLPFTVILLLIIGSFLLMLLYPIYTSNPVNELAFLIVYLFSIIYIFFYVSISMSLKFFVLLALSEYNPTDRWNIKDILKKTVVLATKNWVKLTVLTLIILIMSLALQNLMSILCYCTLGFIYLFSSLPFIIMDIFILGYLMNDYTTNKTSL